MSSRLDRLLLLLESGSTPVIRRSAAEQLGDVQKLYPHELENLLNKVHAYLMNSQWETRVAASQAVEAIIKNVEQWNPPGIPKGKDTQIMDTSNYLSLSAFDISRVLEGGVQLNMCDAKTFDLPVNPDDPVNQDVNNKERLMEQKQQLNKRLGLEMCNTLKIGPTDAFVTEEDFMVEEPTETPAQISSVNDFIKERLLANGEEGGLGRPMDSESVATRISHQSIKRKAEEPEEAQSSKRMKVEGATASASEAPDGGNTPLPTDSEEKQPREWPLMSFSNLLSNNLFSQVWEKRHGSALGLKVLIKLHGRGAGRTADMSSHELSRANQKWLEDLCVRLMCVLALDRLGDFLSDEVVAPVRESCAQVVGVACLHLEPVGIVSVVRALLQLVNYPKDIWEVKHGGLLGIKYVLAVRQDLTEQLLQETLPSVCRGLADNSDDVRSVAASALIPVTNALAKFSPLKALEIIDSLWNSLKELDDLTSSTNSVMTLLSLLVSHPDIYNKCQNDLLSTLVPLTWPFLGHNISSVRRATLLTLNTLLQKSLAMETENNTSCHWLRPILSSMLRLVFQRSIIEHEPSILELVCQVWSSLLSCSDVPHLVSSVVPYFSSWMCLSMQPSSLPLDRNFLLILPSKGGEQVANDNNFLKDEIIYIGGISNIADSESDKDALVIRARLTATRLLGQLCHKIADRKKLSDIKTEKKDEVDPKQPPTSLDPNNPGTGYLDAVANDLGILFQVYLNSKSAVQRMTTAWVVKEWAESAYRNKMHCECPHLLIDRLKTCLGDILYYDEIASKFTRLQTECRAFLASLLTWGAVLEKPFSDVGALLTLEQISQLCGVVSQRGLSLCHGGLTGQQESAYQKQKAELEANLSQVTAQQEVHSNRVQCSIASALVELRSYPDSLNPVIRPLMDCLKMEENSQLQERTAEVNVMCQSVQMASSWRPRKYGPHKNKEELVGVEVTQNAPPLKDPNEVQNRGSVLALISITRRPGLICPSGFQTCGRSCTTASKHLLLVP